MKHKALSTKLETNSKHKFFKLNVFRILDFGFSCQRRGQAALTVVIFLLFILLSILGAISNLSLKEAKGVERNFRSEIAFFSAESGVEDAVYRLKRGRNVSNSFTISLNGSTASTTVSNISGGKEVKSSGEFLQNYRSLRSTLSYGTGANFFYGVQVGAGGLSMGNNAKVNGNIYSNGTISGSNGAKILGDAISIGAMSNIAIGSSTSGTGRAPSFSNTVIHGSACPNQYCIVTNPTLENLPISQGAIDSWKSEAAAGGTYSGTYNVNGIQSLGPKKITGSININSNGTLVVTGTLWVVGDIQSSNNSAIRLDSSYGSNSGLIITDGNQSSISNNVTFSGSGNPQSYIMILATRNAPTQVSIDVSNNSTGVIFYADKSRIHFNNNAFAKEVTAYGITLDNNAQITYESGLANINFSSGPSGGWSISEWKEVIQ